MTSEHGAYRKNLVSHYEKIWGDLVEDTRWTNGPWAELGESFSIARFAAADDALAFATVGMSQPDEEESLELHIFAPLHLRSYDPVVELLTVVAHFHRTGARLGLHHTVNFGRPWLPGASCSYGFISLPHIDGPALERPDGVVARCLWLIPVTESEVAFKRASGVEALEEAFERDELDYLDPGRRPVV